MTVSQPAMTSVECNAGGGNYLPNATYTLGSAGPMPGGWPSAPVLFPRVYDSCGTNHGGGTVLTFGTMTVSNGASSHVFSATNANGHYWDAAGVWRACLFNNNIAAGIGTLITVV